MDPNEEFSRLTTKFLFFNCNDGKNDSSSTELNTLLNDLNSVDYKNPKPIDKNTAARLLESFTRIPSNEETLIVKACCLIVTLVNKEKIQLPPTPFAKIVDWLLKCLNFNYPAIACDILSPLQVLFRSHPNYCRKSWDCLLSPDGLLFGLLDGNFEKQKTPKYEYDTNTIEEIKVSVILCIESLLSPLENLDESEDVDEFLEIVGNRITDIIYSSKTKFNNHIHCIVFITSAINAISKIISHNKDWLETKLGEILGIAKAFILYELPGITRGKPQKVVVSQQSVLEPPPISALGAKGGKVAKTRKPRTVNKNKKKNSKQDDVTKQFGYDNQLKIDFDSAVLSPFNRTSDSDFSESETGRTQNERHKEAKLRLSAISLIALIAKTIEKRIIYGYWHSLFPTETPTQSNNGLLNCVLRDPNPRCRIAALQAASMLIFGSKSYLIQAESSDKAPSSFMPFSISLGNMIMSMYDALTKALSAESSLPVLTQILKCLTVLIQATPFHRLSSGFVTNFVKYIRRLIYHKDPTIQVAALMVMEFLISVQDITKEISDCVGIPRTTIHSSGRNQNRLNDSGVYEVYEPDLDEEILDSDCEEDQDEVKNTCDKNDESQNPKMSWLLQRVLENLGIFITELKTKSIIATTPVRIECLQVLSAMALNFSLLKDHLEVIALALERSLNDPLPEIRLYSGKCLDVTGHSISTALLEQGSSMNDDFTKCQKFWAILLPPVITKIQDHTQSAALKGLLCDFLSNIGVHIFERLPHDKRIHLISILSGISCNEENTVRAAAVRALAVYSVFPSLREDLCYIDNTALLIVELMKDQNLYVRVKASWSMGNVSDALIGSSLESQLDRISDQLLEKLFKAAIDSSKDNDKIRSNAVRTLGNLLRLITSKHLASKAWRTLCFKGIESLVHNINTGNNAKVKWNSCYAIGNFMRNQCLFTNYSDFTWQSTVFSSLSALIINNTNFKVRINGATALATIKQRESYGSHLIGIWSSLLAALEQSDNLNDFNEYKHRDNLQEQLCLTLCHLMRIAQIEDYTNLKNELIMKLESSKQTWIRVINRVLPENAAPLLATSVQLKSLNENKSITNEQRRSVAVLASCFVSPQEYFYS